LSVNDDGFTLIPANGSQRIRKLPVWAEPSFGKVREFESSVVHVLGGAMRAWPVSVPPAEALSHGPHSLLEALHFSTPVAIAPQAFATVQADVSPVLQMVSVGGGVSGSA